MDSNYLRLILVILGIVVIAVIVWDFYRKKRIATEKSTEFNQETLDEMLDTRDLSGFDLNGVGLKRTIDDDELGDFEEPLIASRDDDGIIDDESFSATSDNDSKPTREAETTADEAELIISLSIIARSETGFIGEKLLHCMLSRGLRFGEMNIFHRHKTTAGEGRVQFSLANALKPGIFNLEDMSSFQTKAISLFMMLPGPDEPLKSYKLMLDTAQHLASELDGQLVDSSRSVLTQQTIQHFNEQIQDFERRNITKNKTH